MAETGMLPNRRLNKGETPAQGDVFVGAGRHLASHLQTINKEDISRCQRS